VAVLDSGFRGYRDHLGAALPERVKVRSFRRDHDLEARPSQHGILCAEVIHALAPEAAIMLANWEPERPEQFLEAVRWARREGCRVISCSIIMPTWSDCEGHGPIHEELKRILGPGDRPGDVLCFASAGNTALRHWSGRFRDDGTGHHLWTTDSIDNAVTPWGRERVSVEMCWHSGARYELSVWDQTLEERVGHCLPTAGPGGRCAVVAFTPRSGHAYTVRVRCLDGSVRDEASGFHLVVLGGGLRTARKQGSIPFPADGGEVVAVGAVDERGRRQAYSSCGVGDGAKPDFVASVPFPSLWRPHPFTGTSAAAPQAAALAVLVWSRHPEWNARQVRDQLRRAAGRPGVAGHPDGETGNGRIRLPK
jgi:hypothetical protein